MQPDKRMTDEIYYYLIDAYNNASFDEADASRI